ncbi:MAG: hypothetical protein RL398_1426 [Planctomycetota bacterium]|jgi:hypothetical protein
MSRLPTPPFAAQRLICLALLASMVMAAIAFGAVIYANDGRGLSDEPIPMLGWIALGFAAVTGPLAFFVRDRRLAAAADAHPDLQPFLRFQARLTLLAVLEGGVLFGLVVWLLNGTAFPSVVGSAGLFVAAWMATPLSDPDAAN